MGYQFPPDLDKLVREQMATGKYRSEDDLLRDALTLLNEHPCVIADDDPGVLVGVQRGLDQMQQGLGRPFEEFDADLRTKYHFDHGT